MLAARAARRRVSTAASEPTPHTESMERRWHPGYCARTSEDEVGACDSDDKGTWQLKPSLVNMRNWSALTQFCLRRCRACERCRYLSVSRVWRSCDWFAVCNTSALHQQPNGFWTTAKLGPARQRATTVPLIDPGKASASQLAEGYCEVVSITDAAPACDERDLGAWALSDAHSHSWTEATAHCAARCAACSRCRFISVSLSLRRCSYFAACPQLRHEIDGYRTARVGARPSPGPSPRLLAACPALAALDKEDAQAAPCGYSFQWKLTRPSRRPKCADSSVAARVLDCWLNASLLRDADEPGAAGRALLLFAAPLLRPALRRGRHMLSAQLPRFERWHLQSQERLFVHLRRITRREEAPRIMVDLGCHAGLGPYRNESDALIWLRYFNRSGAVLAVDAFEDYVLDHQFRFDHGEPFGRMSGVERLTAFAALGSKDGATAPMDQLAYGATSCCAGKWCSFPEQTNPDHFCRITRQRLGVSRSVLPLPASALHPPGQAKWILDGMKGAPPFGRYEVPQRRADSLVLERLPHVRLDMLKVDIDMPWTQMGLERLIVERRFRLMTIEIDGTWSSVPDPEWQVSAADQLVWFAGRHGYKAFLKVPCTPAPGVPPGIGEFGGRAAWYWPFPALPTRLQASDFQPSGTMAQDMLLVDAAEPHLVQQLRRLARLDCVNSTELSSLS